MEGSVADHLKQEENVLDVQAVLHHLDEHLRAQMLAYHETPADKQEMLAEANKSLERAKERFYMLNSKKGVGVDQNDPELRKLLLQAEEDLYNLGVRSHGSGPPLS